MNITGEAGSSSPLFPNNKSGVWGESDSGYGVAGTSNTGNGVQGGSVSGIGVVGTSDSSSGVVGMSASETGVYGESDNGVGYGVHGNNTAKNGVGVRGEAKGSLGAGVIGQNQSGPGVLGLSADNVAVAGASDNSYGVGGVSNGSGFAGVSGSSNRGYGVIGYSEDPHFSSVQGASTDGTGVEGQSNNVAISAMNSFTATIAWLGTRSRAADFHGDVWIAGNLHKTGGGFKIDHPLSPSDQYLSHSFLESSERKNLYDGRVSLDEHGRASVSVAAWMGALNSEFLYQLTPMKLPCPHLHIAKELQGDSFEMAGGSPGAVVCWQITGVRRDKWAEANPVDVESPKTVLERGFYVNPELHGAPPEKGIFSAIHPNKTESRQDLSAKSAKLRAELSDLVTRHRRDPPTKQD